MYLFKNPVYGRFNRPYPCLESNDLHFREISNELKSMKRLLTHSESIYFILEDKVIVLNVTFENIENEHPKYLLNGASEFKFNSGLIPDRSKILGYFQINYLLDFELISNGTNLDSFLLDFREINKNIAYKYPIFPKIIKKFNDNLFKLIKNNNYFSEMNFVLFEIADCEEEICIYEFDYYDSNLNIFKYLLMDGERKVFVSEKYINLTSLELLDKKSIAKQK